MPSPPVRFLAHALLELPIFVTGDTIRRAVQWPLLAAMAWEDVSGIGTLEVLDAGCGRGVFGRGWRRIYGPRVTGCDPWEEGLEEARGRGCYLDLVKASLPRLPFPDAAFDRILCTDVLEHIEDDGAAVRELSRLLKPGGKLLLSVPVPPAPFRDPAHVREGYGVDDLLALGKRANLRLERLDFFFLGISRALFRGSGWTRKHLGVYLPLLPLAYLERIVPARWRSACRPYSLVAKFAQEDGHRRTKRSF